MMRFGCLMWCCLLFSNLLLAQTDSTLFKVMSYNVENCFDTIDNPEVDDEEFLPESNRHWTEGRFDLKLQHLSQVILSAGEWAQFALVGLCEVENDTVMTQLLNRTALRQSGYRYCMTHGQDKRGINVALLYQRDRFRLIGSEEIEIDLPKGERPTRNILHVWGEVESSDTLDVFVCHMPSRSGGELESRPKRLAAAHRLNSVLDSLGTLRQSSHFMIMGDFNDTPTDKSLSEVLKAGDYPAASAVEEDHLYNLFYSAEGSHKYRGEWSQLDHLIVNGRMLDSKHSFHLLPGSSKIYKEPFLLTEDKTGGDKRPFRTYLGPKYEGGYSDHLPLVATFVILTK